MTDIKEQIDNVRSQLKFDPDFQVQPEQDFIDNYKDAWELNWVGELAHRAAFRAANERINPVLGAITPFTPEEGFKPPMDEVRKYPINVAKELYNASSELEYRHLKEMYATNTDLRKRIEANDSILAQLAVGLTDPINLVPIIGATRSVKWIDNLKTALPNAAIGIVPTEILRHNLDPTSTVTETMANIALGTALGTAIGGAVGTLGARWSARAGRVLGNQVRNDFVPEYDMAPNPIKVNDILKEQELNNPNYDSWIAGNQDDGLGNVYRYQEAGGRKWAVIQGNEGEKTVISDQPNVVQPQGREAVLSELQPEIEKRGLHLNLIDSDKGSLAGLNVKLGRLTINMTKLTKDYEAGLNYIQGKGLNGRKLKSGTSAQKAVVFEGIDTSKLKQWFDANGGVESYLRFIVRHEIAHADLSHEKVSDLMSPRAIQIEKEANSRAFRDIGLSESWLRGDIEVPDGWVPIKAGASGDISGVIPGGRSHRVESFESPKAKFIAAREDLADSESKVTDQFGVPVRKLDLQDKVEDKFAEFAFVRQSLKKELELLNEMKDKPELFHMTGEEAQSRIHMIEDKINKVDKLLDDVRASDLSLEDISIAHMERLTSSLGALDMPMYRIMGTKLKRTMPELARDWIVTLRQLVAQPNFYQRGGERGLGGTGSTVEGRAKYWEGRAVEAKAEVDKIWGQMIGMGDSATSFEVYMKANYRSLSDIYDSAKEKTASKLGRTIEGRSAEDGMKIETFYENVADELISGKSENPFVKRAAEVYRKLYREFQKELEENGMLANKAGVSNMIDRTNTRIASLQETIARATNKEAKDYASQLLAAEEKRLNNLTSLSESLGDGRIKSDYDNYFHRIWRIDTVKERVDDLKKLLSAYYEQNPHVRVTDKNGNVAVKTLSTDEAAIAERVDKTIASITKEAAYGDSIGAIEDTAGSLPSYLIGRRLDIPNDFEYDGIKLLDFILRDANEVMTAYSESVGRFIEMGKRFGDSDMRQKIENLRFRALERNASPADLKEIDTLEKNMGVLRDVVLGRYRSTKDPSAWTHRAINVATQYNMLTSMGRVVLVAMNDIGTSVMAHGVRKTFGALFKSAFTSAKNEMSEWNLAAKEVQMYGEAVDSVNNFRAYSLGNADTGFTHQSQLERSIGKMTGRMFIINGMSPWTDMIKKTGGALSMSRMIEDSINWVSLSAKRKRELSRIGFTEDFARRVVEQWKKAGSQKGEYLYLPNTVAWTDQELARDFGAMLTDEVNRVVMTPTAGTIPMFVRSDWGRLFAQYKKFGIIATQNLLLAGIQRHDVSTISTFLSMILISYLVDTYKRPDYIQLSPEDALFRAVEISGVTGSLLDANQMIEESTAGEYGLRPLMGLKPFDRNPSVSSQLGGAFGPVVNQWGTLTQAIIDPNQGSKELIRATRYMIPFNNMIWWNDLTNRIQRTAIDMAEE